MNEIELLLDYPSNLARDLKNGSIDMALLPVAAIPEIPGARIVSNYGIAADGEVASVALFSQVPLEQVESVFLDYQSRTSVRLAQLLLEKWWKQPVELHPAPADYIDQIQGTRAGVIIGDRAMEQVENFAYCYDLSQAWKDWTGLPFIFAAWVANKDLPEDFLARFDEANAEGLNHIDDVVAQHPFSVYDLQTYFRKNIIYELDAEKRAGLQRFFQEIGTLEAVIAK
jgi:chorismate dehydratase